MPIQRLSILVVNQIAAGEVIERPASVVKELVENSIDAGATSVRIRIEDGGREVIEISDDGCGIPVDELPLALAPHATSKITSTEDLDGIASMGFRGEALASIASVSRLSMRSRAAGAKEAMIIESEGGTDSTLRPVAAPVGTCVTVRNLFFNTPARRKFLKTAQTESGRITEIVQTLAIAHPSVGFTLESDGRRRAEYPPKQTARRRILAVLGEELESMLFEVELREGPVALWGLAGMPEIARATSRHQRLFLNGRAIQDRAIAHAIRESYRGLVEPSRHPMVVLYLELDPTLVDVNVHPAKAEVRFRDGSSVHRAVRHALRDGLRARDLTPAVDLARSGAAVPFAPAPTFTSGLSAPTGSTATHVEPRGVVDSFRRLAPRDKGFVIDELREVLADVGPARPNEVDAESLPPARRAESFLQVHDSYLVAEDDDGLVIIDQHALHERVMFEKLKARIEARPLESQRMLMPVTLEVDVAHMEALSPLRPLFERLGIEVDAIGPQALAVHAFTSLLFERGVEPADFLRELMGRVVDHDLPAEPEAALSEVLDMMACKAAVKAGDSLTPAEIAELLAYREQIDRSSNCPHGRPTTLRLTLHDLERQFGRS